MAVPQRRRRVEPPDLAIAEFDFTNEVSDPDDRLDHAQLFLGEPYLSSMPIHDQTCICSRMKAEPLSMLIESIVAWQNASATAGTPCSMG
jgi:hypothetical protein